MPAPLIADDPFHIAGPAVISFSGGRTSAYMLWRILEAHGGQLPDDVVACFANTGREMGPTLDFVRDCGAHWNVPIHWLEYRHRHHAPRYAVVSHNSASRAGEPFALAIEHRSYLPNPVARFCTEELKLNTIARFLRETRGWASWRNVVGLRADESARVARVRERNALTLCPLADAGIEELDVLRFWRAQPFDLRLAGSWEGNCDGCFLKARGALERVILDHPERMAWWADQEERGSSFRADRESYATMAQVVRDQGRLLFLDEEPLPCDQAMCGV